MSCAHCGSTRLTDVGPHREWRYAGETCALRRCQDCGGIFSHPLPSPALLARLYGEEFNYGWYRDHYPAKLIDALIRVVQYRKMGLCSGRILDYGGGLGYFSQAARLMGHDATTYDPAMAGTPPPSGAFDTVVCHHVLEHARRPEEMLAAVERLLTSSGTLVVAVPNAGSLGYEKLGMDFVWSQPPFIHIHHFTAAGLRALLEREGWRVLSESYFERWDASTLADVRLARIFAAWDGRWGSARWRWGRAQLNSARRFLALLGTPLLGRAPAERRPELLVVARRGASA
jgi:SAM-dependent methyltransferase